MWQPVGYLPAMTECAGKALPCAVYELLYVGSEARAVANIRRVGKPWHRAGARFVKIARGNASNIRRLLLLAVAAVCAALREPLDAVGSARAPPRSCPLLLLLGAG